MIHVLAQIELAPGARAAFLHEFHQIVPLVRAEPGCIEYGAAIDAATDIPMQAPPRTDVVTIVERWADVPALKAHLAAPHMHAYRPKVKEFVLRVELKILEPV